MTDSELDEIERALSLKLPDRYRRLSRAFPFRAVEPDWVYWFYDEPRRVIDATRQPLAGGDYEGKGWKRGYVVIGESADGDPYLIDTARNDPAVDVLSHETHAIERAWSDLGEFEADWLGWMAEAEEKGYGVRRKSSVGWPGGWVLLAALVVIIAGGVFLFLSGPDMAGKRGRPNEGPAAPE